MRSTPSLAYCHTFERLREETREGSLLEFRYGRTTVPSLHTLEALHPDFRIPLGFLWFSQEDGKRLSLGFVFVHEQVRQVGLATRLLERLIEDYPGAATITTGRGNELSTPWLRKNGFEIAPEGHWVRTLWSY